MKIHRESREIPRRATVGDYSRPRRSSYPTVTVMSVMESERGEPVEHMIQLHIEKLPEGVYLATSEEVQGLFDYPMIIGT